MKKRNDGLLFKFGLFFAVFTIVTLFLCSLMMYFSQMQSYKKQCQENIRMMGKYLESMILNEGQEFQFYQRYYMGHYHDMEIPIDFDDFHDKKMEFHRLFHETYPGMTYGDDLTFSQLTPELQKTYAEYMQEYWLLTFEAAKRDFNLAYCYYLTVDENEDDSYEVYYMIDAERTEREGSGGKFLHLGDQYHHTPENQEIEWTVWSTGKAVNKFQEWDNNYGHTYTNYVPLIIDGNKMGLICTEVDVDKVNLQILLNTIKEMLLIAVVLILCVVGSLVFLNKVLISKIIGMSEDVERYSADKDASIAKDMEKYNNTGDELSDLAGQISSMIVELDFHMKNLIATHKELTETRERASSMQALANKDALTGVRNKTAYDNELALIEKGLKESPIDFGIAMIDLNYLKKINDTFGHEQGNTAIKKLCHMVCVIFDHSPVFRIGGDEFVVILRGHDLEHFDELQARFEEEMEFVRNDENTPQWEKVSAAIGAAFFDPAIDSTAADVFKRADNMMYERKKEMKAIRLE
ncbi:MAG: GGDEF domain-containing protein [Lachnospiraceae bacterium]|nr:GGDEF domain-containing protein [Lachnospiraceae bacterium]